MALTKNQNGESIIGDGSTYTGKMNIQGTLRVNGTYEGEMLKIDQLYIGPNGKVRSNVKAHNIFIEGILIGNIQAEVRVVLQSTARVLGEIKTPEIIIQNGVILEGKCTVSNDLKTSAANLIHNLYKAD
jgi:cytoskeletal protein CcmA (bactofilin family)